MGEPHYHRRRRVSLLSSGWDQVVPRRYGRQGRGGSSAFAPAPHGLKSRSGNRLPPREVAQRVEESAMDGGFLTLLLVRRISRDINRKRVTSVKVNSNQTSFGNRSFEESSDGGWDFRRGICTYEATWGYMVKPHGSLVSVSSTHYCASTPDLSTTWS